MSAVTTISRIQRRGYRHDLETLAAAQKPAAGTAAYSRLVNRPVARRVAAAAHQVGLTPNGATAVSATLSATGLVLVATVAPTWPLGVGVAVLLAAGYVMDSVDGQLARLRGRGSVAGEWLDHTADCVKTCALHLVVLIALYRFVPELPEPLLLLPMAFLVVDVTCYFGILQMPALRAARGTAPRAARPEGRWRRWLILPTDYGVFCWMFVLLGAPAVFVAGYALMFAANAALLALACGKWWRELRAIDAEVAR